MPTDERDERGQFESKHGVTAEDVFETMEPLEPYTTGELADMVGAPQRTVFNYLNDLAEQGRIRKKKPQSSKCNLDSD